MVQFEIGKTYKMHSLCNHECIWKYKVLERTKSFITILDIDENKVKKVKVHPISLNGNFEESCKPLGNYSLCPILRATNVI